MDSDINQLADQYRDSLSVIDTIGSADGRNHAVFRCRVDGELVFQTQTSLARHAGHLMHKPVKLSDIEKQLIEKTGSIEELEKVIHA